MRIDGNTLTLTREEAESVVLEDLGYHEDKEILNDYGNETFDIQLTFQLEGDERYWGLEYYESYEYSDEMFEGHKPDEITCCLMKPRVVQQIIWREA